jgi:hypothetical protein
MKKLYFSILLLGAHSLSFGQIMPKPLVSNDISKVKPLKTNLTRRHWVLFSGKTILAPLLTGL